MVDGCKGQDRCTAYRGCVCQEDGYLLKDWLHVCVNFWYLLESDCFQLENMVTWGIKQMCHDRTSNDCWWRRCLAFQNHAKVTDRVTPLLLPWSQLPPALAPRLSFPLTVRQADHLIVIILTTLHSTYSIPAQIGRGHHLPFLHHTHSRFTLQNLQIDSEWYLWINSHGTATSQRWQHISLTSR